ncbi:MAG TPA: phytoene/squalene synthase family protein [Xanthobacteraceae bacterium]|jgi:15-cis-phytoene synthase|nr:phytoene/squalene synthase family protein [Xanthobacteraceae bacterium]
MSAAMRSNYRFCRKLVRAHDKDRYLAGLFVPSAKRKHLFALYAFNYEIARIRELVHEPMPGELRLQWWRDALEGQARGDVARHPVANVLLATIEKFSLPRPQCLELIDAHTFDLYDDAMPDVARLETYCDSTAGALFRLAVTLLAGRELQGVGELLQHAGRAYAITGLLRAFTLHASRGQVYLPLELLARHGIMRDDIVTGKGAPGLAAALAEIRGLARGHYDEASRRTTSLPRDAISALLPLELVPLYLDRMEEADYDPFKTPVEVVQWRRQWRLWRASRRL